MNDDDVRRVLGGLQPHDHHLDPPPPAVWDRIREELGHHAEPSHDHDADPGGDAVPAVAELPVGRRSRIPLLAAAAAVVIVSVTAGALLWSLKAPSTLARGQLIALDVRADDVTATVVADGGRHTLLLPADLAPPGPGSHYEVWLLDSSISDIMSLGPLRDDGRYPIPDQVSWEALPVVDVSAEPTDGDPGHSGDSVLRGTLR